MKEWWKVDRRASLLLVPYLCWTGFAGYLNEEVGRRNGWDVLKGGKGKGVGEEGKKSK